MKNIKFAILFLLFTAVPILTIDNVRNNIEFGISITYEADSLFELGDIAITCGTSNTFTIYDSLKERKTAAQIIALQNKDQQLDQNITAIRKETNKIDENTYNSLQKQLQNLTINSKRGKS